MGEHSAFRNLALTVPSWERDRLTAAEVCIDEALSIMGRHDIESTQPDYQRLKSLSGELDIALEEADGPEDRYHRLVRVRDALDGAFPHPDAEG